jgi:hypothetical protein
MIKGDAVADGGFWDTLGAVAEAIGGDSDAIAPDNMMSRDSGEALSIPMAVHGANYILNDGRPLWLAWSGGKPPYRIRFTADGVAAVHDGIAATAVSLDLPRTLPPRLRMTLEDAVGRRTSISIRLRDKRPDPEFGSSSGTLARTLAYAAWLTGVQEGRWSIEAARVLNGEAASDPSALQLLSQISAGWRIGLPRVQQSPQ